MGFDKKQLVSTMVDDELSLENSFEQIKNDTELQDTWSRYHLIGDLMRDQAFPDLDISEAVHQAVAEEATVLAPAGKEPQPLSKNDSNVISIGQKLWQKAGGFAIAASVALVALYSVPNSQQNVSASNPQVAAIETASESAVLATEQTSRLELQTMHEMFITHDQLAQRGGIGLPTIHVVSNQKVIPITVNIPMRPEQKKEKEQIENVQQDPEH